MSEESDENGPDNEVFKKRLKDRLDRIDRRRKDRRENAYVCRFKTQGPGHRVLTVEKEENE